MARDQVLYGSALLDDTVHPINIDDIDRAFTRLHKFYCPHCHNEMYATFGDVQAPHFRHNGDKCQHSKYLHDLAEHVFYEEYTKCLDNGIPFFLDLRIPLPCNRACVLKQHIDCREHYIHKTVDLTKEYTFVSLETCVDIDDHHRRPDVLLESLDGKQLWVEIWVSHETEEDKRKEGRIIELKIETEKDLDKIRQHKIVQSEGKELAVRIFSIDTDGADMLFMDDDLPVSSYPCERFFCFETGAACFKADIIDYVKTTISTELTYRIILRLNWKGRHDSVGGYVGKQTTQEELRSICLQRYYSYLDNGALYLDKSYDSLIVSEWKAASIKSKPVPVATPYYRSTYRPHYKPTPQSVSTPVDIDKIEWVDLGLPSGTLWAKNDIEGIMPFRIATKQYGNHLPSYSKAIELRENCRKEWDETSNAVVFTGPNGNELSFPCRNGHKSYWLNAYEHDDPGFAQCFHIEPNTQFSINDKDSYSFIFVRLVK